MKISIRFFLGLGMALLAAAAAHAQLSPTGISASPGTALPGDNVTFTINVSNGGVQSAATANFNLVLTHLVTGATITIPGAAPGDAGNAVSPTGGFIPAAVAASPPTAASPGTGTFVFTAQIPTSTTQAGNYSARVTMSTGVPANFSVSTSVLTVTGKPDLEITGLTYAASTSYVGGNVIPISLTYKNNSSTNGTRNVPYTPRINGMPSYVRIQVVLSTNPTFGDGDDFQLTLQDITSGNVGTVDNFGNAAVNADGATHTFNWQQVLPGNFSGSYYVLAKIDSQGSLPQNDPPALTVNGNNIWVSNPLNPTATLINLLPSNFPTAYLGSHGTGATTSATGYSDNPSVTSDGRYVAFASDATDLVAGDSNAARDIFIFDYQTNLVRRLSVSQQGSQGNGASNNPAISGNGRYVAFSSEANNLIVGDTNGFSDIYVVDVITGLISRVSVATGGGQANNPSFRPAISTTGRYIVFESSATNLDAAYTVASGTHIYIRDRDVSGSGVFDTAGNVSTRLADVDSATPASVVANASSIQAAISSDGSTIAFSSRGTNLVAPATTAARQHVYTRARTNVGTATSGVRLISVANTTAAEGGADSQTPSLSSTGRYVAFASVATNLVAADNNQVSDIFVYDTAAPVGVPIVRRMSVSTTGAEGYDPSASGFRLGSINPTISSDGRYVAFASLAANLTTGDSGGKYQGSGATATANLAVGAIASFTIGAGGTQYSQSNPPAVIIIDATGTGASGTAVVSAAGVITSITVSAGGAGYTAPIVTIASDANNALDIFVRDRDVSASGTFDTGGNVSTQMVSVNGFGFQTSGLLGVASTASSNIYPVLSADGRYVAFPSDAENNGGFAFGATNLLPRDSNGVRDIFLFDRRTTAAITPGTAPVVTITSPGNGGTALVNTAIPINASATTTIGVVASVQFYVNGTSLGVSSVFPYTQTWTPTAVGTYTLSALVTDSFGNIGVSSNVTVTINAAPSVGVTSPATGASITVNTLTNITATAAASNPGATISNVQFYVNGASQGTVAAAPYTVAWTPTLPGVYSLTAVATDSVGTQKTSPTVSVTVVPGGGGGPVVIGNAPTVSVTSPGNGSVIRVGTTNTLASSAADSDGNIASVQFLVNGFEQGPAVTAFPYRTTWTPTAEGVYRISATALDNATGSTTSSTVTVLVTAASNSGDTVANGIIVGPNENGTFSAINARGKTATFIGVSTAGGVSKTYYFAGVPVGTNGSFSATDALARPTLSGSFTETGAFGTLENGRVSFSGAVTFPGAVASVAPGFYAGNLSGRLSSTLSAIIGADGSIALYVADGTFQAAGFGSVDATGAFNVLTSAGVRFTGKADPATGFLTGTLTGGPGGTIMAATSGGVSFSDGFLRNLSTRGQVGTGANILIAGFVVGGATPKQVLVRAVGPTLTAFGVTSALADPQLVLLSGNTVVAQNDNWATPIDVGSASGGTISAASASVGAFALGSTGADAVIFKTLAPGNYTAQVSGVGGGTGIALVEVWDVDNPAAFSAQKVMNVSTRGLVGTGQNQLIAGFVVSGNTPKKVLIRGVGPSLGVAAPSLAAGVLADPVLRLMRRQDGVDTLVRENDNWEVGNDAAQVTEIATKVGAFALTAGSKDAVILINLPPGTYTTQLTGVGTTTGLALVEVYEVP